MNLPINGRIAIIDDQLKHAEPLIKVLSSKQLPHSYFSGELQYLPQEGHNTNDIRLIFLDINLIDDGEHSNAVLKGRLVPVLNRVISERNYPYVIMYWSRHEHHKDLIEKDIFVNELKNKRPIGFLSAVKSSFFNLDGTPSEEIDIRMGELFDKINDLINESPVYSYLLHWENQVHISADMTLQKVFSAYHSFPKWSDNANFLFKKFGKSYSGNFYSSQNSEEKIKSSFQAFNNVFIDSLGYSTNNTTINKPIELEFDEQYINKEAIFSINKNLLVSDDKGPLEYSGAIAEDQNLRSDPAFKDLLNNALNRSVIKNKISADEQNSKKTIKEIEKLTDKTCSKIREEIRSTWKKIYCVVTPLCDYVQGKYTNCRVVKGMMIHSKFKEYIDDKSEAIFVSPTFNINNETHVIVLHFRYFFTIPNSNNIKFIVPLFRLRQQLLAEIQSRLARHISRQGILFLDER